MEIQKMNIFLRRLNVFTVGPACILAALLLTGCPTESVDDGNNDDDDNNNLVTDVFDYENVLFLAYSDTPTGIKYYSLSQGAEVDASKRATAEWDIALEAIDAFFYLYTNSGYTATEFGGTGGQGGVWFTNKTDFDSVLLSDRVTDFSGENAEYAAYVTDVKRYQPSMTGTPIGTMNIMTYYGYEGGDGSYSNPFTLSTGAPFGHPFFEFNKKAFAAAGTTMPPSWYETNQVYVIRHADGASYSKFQVYDFFYTRGYKYTISFKFEPLTE
jgi:hypothetical protein